MPVGSNHQFSDNEGVNLNAAQLNSLGSGGNVYSDAGGLTIAITAAKFTSTGGFVSYAGAGAIAIPPSTTTKVWLDAAGVLNQGAAFPGTEHLPLASVVADGIQVVSVADERPDLGSTTTTPGGGGDVAGPAGATADAVAVYDGVTGKLLKDGPTPGAASGLATLDAGGKLTPAQIPTAVGDVTGPGINTAGALALFSGTTGKILADGPVPGAAGGVATLNGSSKVVEDPANATATPTASKIPIADGSGKLDDAWLNGNTPFGADQVETIALARTTNNTAVFAAKVSYVTPALTGTYRIDWKAEIDNAGFLGEVKIRNVTDAADLDGPQIRKATDAGEVLPVGGFATIVLAGVAKTFEIQWRDQAGGNTQGLQRARLALYRIA